MYLVVLHTCVFLLLLLVGKYIAHLNHEAILAAAKVASSFLGSFLAEVSLESFVFQDPRSVLAEADKVS